MILVLFEVTIKKEYMNEYLTLAAALKDDLLKMKGLIRAERFSSLVNDGKLLSLSVWEDEQAISEWRNKLEHRAGQQQGHGQMFEKYTITVAWPIRAYTGTDRLESPNDSNLFLNLATTGEHNNGH